MAARASAPVHPEPARFGPAWNIPARPDVAVVRERLLESVQANLGAGRRVLLCPPDGRAGTGTTALPIEFAHHNRDDYDVAWWVPAADPVLIPDRMAELAEVLGLASITDDAESATARLLDALAQRGRWLIVFDDAESPHDLARFLPRGPGDVLIASTDPEWRELATAVEVGTFTREESVALLTARVPRLPPAEADRLAEALEDLPLAVDPAAVMLADTGLAVDTYLRLLEAWTGNLQAGGRTGLGAVEASWAVAFDRLAGDDPAALALLTAVSWLGSAPVPFSLFLRDVDELPAPLADAVRDPSKLLERAATLHRRGLARVVAADLRLHPVPAALLRARSGQMTPRGLTWAAAAVRLLRAAAPEDPGNDPASWRMWRELLPHVLAATDPVRPLDTLVAEVGWLLGGAGIYLQVRGEPHAARALFEDAHDLFRRRLGEDHPDTVASARNLAADLHDLGHHELAEQVTHPTGLPVTERSG